MREANKSLASVMALADCVCQMLSAFDGRALHPSTRLTAVLGKSGGAEQQQQRSLLMQTSRVHTL